MNPILVFLIIVSSLSFYVERGPGPVAAEDRLLWEIGKPDKSDTEMALAPDKYRQFKTDGFFVVGESNSRIDWPYVHPGPDDVWAAAREHTFTILFGLAAAPEAGDSRLMIDLLDSHGENPPRLRIEINDRAFERPVAKGAGDETIGGRSRSGKTQRISVPIPAGLLKSGDNEIRITTLNGSWILYDWLGLMTSSGAGLARVQARTTIGRVQPLQALVERDHRQFQPVLFTLRHSDKDTDAEVRIGGEVRQKVRLVHGEQGVEVLVPAVSTETQQSVEVVVAGIPLPALTIPLKPVRKLTVYILPHSHTDIGYTEIQTDIEKKQVNNLLAGIAYARKTADYPAGARFVWNVEVLWAADLYLHRLSDRQRADFFEAVKKGQVSLNGMYLNELTGLCRPEELIRLFRLSTKLSGLTGVPIDSAMISDVPGYTWGTVTALVHAGIRYFSVAPNYFDRIGTILREWENKPFYWAGPDGKSKVLVWIPFWGYAMSHRYGKLSPQLVNDFCDGLEKRNYPFDIAHVRWAGHGDNAVPDPAICEFVKDWNRKYTWPKFIISGTGEAFRAFEQHYGDKLPVVRGDWTPYWEDGAGSSALETAMNRQSSDRLAQAATLFSLLRPAAYPSAAFEDAWNSVLLYSEHTWGAWCSISEPERKETREQWEIKRGYALRADRQSRDLLEKAVATATLMPGQFVDVFNTLSWPRTDLVVVAPALSSAGGRVTDDQGRPVVSQRLSTGELAFLAKDIPPLAARRFGISAGQPFVEARASVAAAELDSGVVHVRLDIKTGGIAELSTKELSGNFADTRDGEELNDFLYLIGDEIKDIQRAGPASIRTGEKGPLVASLVVDSKAPGCNSLRREVRVVAGLDHVELLNHVDKARLVARDYKSRAGKESLNFAFPFMVPEGEVYLDVPLGIMRPEVDQMPSANKNWFTVGRWADVSNTERGITWVTLDAPLVQIGGITATLLNSQTNPDVWRKKVDPTQKLYSWAMNNHWGTNYRAYQEGPVEFRYILRPHLPQNSAEISRFATGFSQPLVAVRAGKDHPSGVPLLRVEPADVLVIALSPSDDGKATIVRLFGASGQAREATLRWGRRKPTGVFLSDTGEVPGSRIAERVEVPGFGLVTLRVEW